MFLKLVKRLLKNVIWIHCRSAMCLTLSTHSYWCKVLMDFICRSHIDSILLEFIWLSIHYFRIFYCILPDLCFISFLFLTFLQLLIHMSRYDKQNKKTVIKCLNYCLHDRLQSELYSHVLWPTCKKWHTNSFHPLLYIIIIFFFFLGLVPNFLCFGYQVLKLFSFVNISNTQQFANDTPVWRIMCIVSECDVKIACC